MRYYGGLRKHIPLTYWAMMAGTLAITGVGVIGVFGFAGFYSKDAIIETAFASDSDFGPFAFWCSITAALLTSFYSWRLMFMTFEGRYRPNPHAHHDDHGHADDHGHGHDHAHDHGHQAPKDGRAPAHALYIGFFGSLLVAMVTRVTQGHSGRPLELDALVGAVREIGAQVGVPTPTLDGLYGLTRLMARSRGLYPDTTR